MTDQRRGSERIEILGTLPGAATVRQPVVVRELGPRGARIESAFPLHIDAIHEFKLALGERAVVVKGRVAHCQISAVDHDAPVYRAGIEFVDPSDAVLAAIAEFIDHLRQDRLGAGG
jgi:hypothetical protein